MSERLTEKLVRDLLAQHGYTEANRILVEEQKSQNVDIDRLLKTASKAGTGKKGAPEFIVTAEAYPDVVVVVECKADPAFHTTAELNKPVEYAFDGAVHYAKHLAKRYNVIAVGASGQSKKELKLSFALISKGTVQAKPLLTFSDVPAAHFEPLSVLHDYASRDPEVEKRRVSDLMAFARELHNFMRDYAKLSESEKPLLISGILIALQDEAFRAGYSKKSGARLPEMLKQAITGIIEDAPIPQAKKPAMLHPYGFIAAHPTLGKPIKGSTETPLQRMVKDIDEHVFPFITKVGEDIVGRFYGEFLRYTGGDGKGLGIVLTPRHVTELFCDLAELTVDDVVLDTCCGTAGFLISGMHRMLNLPGVTHAKREAIKANQLVGVEQQANMYALAASNMILRGDGKANLYQSSCFEAEVTEKVKALKPTIGFINPPYSQKGGDLHEFNFIEHMLDCLQKNGRGIAIVPMGCAVAPHPLKAKILEKHTLEAVMSMPDDLFYPVGVVTCIMVFRAHRPHDGKRKTWFGYWKDDGFGKTKNDGRVDKKSNWPAIRDRWLEQYANRDSAAGECVKASVTANDEWCAEAYLETDVSKLRLSTFDVEVRKLLAYRLSSVAVAPSIDATFDTEAWKPFSLGELFELKKGKRLTKDEMIPGTTLYVGATETNNGITERIGQEALHPGGQLTVSYNGSVAEAFYQGSPFWASDDVNVLYPRFEMSPKSALFLATLIRLEKYRYNYGRKWKLDAMRATTLRLPVDSAGRPDFLQMEGIIGACPSSDLLDELLLRLIKKSYAR
jgi:hypothetical protein